MSKACRKFEAIRPGSRVTILTRHGQTQTGRAVMPMDPRYGQGWVLNLGGRYGTPGICTPDNLVLVGGRP